LGYNPETDDDGVCEHAQKINMQARVTHPVNSILFIGRLLYIVI